MDHIAPLFRNLAVLFALSLIFLGVRTSPAVADFTCEGFGDCVYCDNDSGCDAVICQDSGGSLIIAPVCDGDG